MIKIKWCLSGPGISQLHNEAPRRSANFNYNGVQYLSSSMLPFPVPDLV